MKDTPLMKERKRKKNKSAWDLNKLPLNNEAVSSTAVLQPLPAISWYSNFGITADSITTSSCTATSIQLKHTTIS